MATSADVLGSNTRIKIPARWARHYQQLCAERDKLLERDSSAGGAFQPKIDDMADAASQEAQRSISLVSATATHGLLLEIIEAIRRIELGTYGICQITGEPIASGRLNSIPWARYSLKGQQQMEQAGRGHKISLPPLEGLTASEPREAESD